MQIQETDFLYLIYFFIIATSNNVLFICFPDTVAHILDQFYRIAYWIGDLAHTQTKQSSGSIRSK